MISIDEAPTLSQIDRIECIRSHWLLYKRAMDIPVFTPECVYLQLIVLQVIQDVL